MFQKFKKHMFSWFNSLDINDLLILDLCLTILGLCIFIAYTAWDKTLRCLPLAPQMNQISVKPGLRNILTQVKGVSIFQPVSKVARSPFSLLDTMHKWLLYVMISPSLCGWRYTKKTVFFLYAELCQIGPRKRRSIPEQENENMHCFSLWNIATFVGYNYLLKKKYKSKISYKSLYRNAMYNFEDRK